MFFFIISINVSSVLWCSASALSIYFQVLLLLEISIGRECKALNLKLVFVIVYLSFEVFLKIYFTITVNLRFHSRTKIPMVFFSVIVIALVNDLIQQKSFITGNESSITYGNQINSNRNGFFFFHLNNSFEIFHSNRKCLDV